MTDDEIRALLNKQRQSVAKGFVGESTYLGPYGERLANAALEARAEAAALRDRLAVVEGEKEIWKSRAERYVHERNDALNLNSMRAQQLAAAWLAADAARAEVAALQSTPAQKEQSE